MSVAQGRRPIPCLRPPSRLVLGALLLVVAPSSFAARTVGDLHSSYGALLERYVVDQRWVDYEAWHANPEDLRALQRYVDGLQEIDPTTLDSDDQRLAYWINLYNALTLDLVLDHYPIGSIKDLGGLFSSPWDRQVASVADRPLTLDDIEHRIIRRRFDDPRIHFALNCASVSCPPLAPFAYRGEDLERQLDRVTRRTVNDPDFVRIGECGAYGEGRIRLNRIFDWYVEDFGGESGVREFLAYYRPEEKFALRNSRCGVDYVDYDWSLNAASGRSSSP